MWRSVLKWGGGEGRGVGGVGKCWGKCVMRKRFDTKRM